MEWIFAINGNLLTQILLVTFNY